MHYSKIVLSFGYEEEVQAGWLVLTTKRENLETIEATLQNVAHELFNWWWRSRGFWLSPPTCRCCKHKVDKTAEDFSADVAPDFADWLQKLPNMTADSMAFLEEVARWWEPWSSWKDQDAILADQTVVVSETAESVLPLFIDPDKLEEDPWVQEGYRLWLTRYGDLEATRKEAIENHVPGEAT